MANLENTLVVLIGPTAVGKTGLALSLAQHYDSPIINADSRQLYRDIPIGTAAPTASEQAIAKHYFVGTLSLADYYSAAHYESEALSLIARLFETHSTLVLTGGSMMYIDAVCKGIDDIPTIRDDVRENLLRRLQTEGLEPLLEELKGLDPEYYAIVDKKNQRRILHGLEVCLQTGCTYTSFRQGTKRSRPFRILKIGLDRPRSELFDRINGRVTQMVEDGFIEEARRVYPYRSYNALNTVGYKEIFRYFDGEWELDMALDRIRKNTRVYAKKQLTWFKRDNEIKWYHPHQIEQIIRDTDACIKP